MGVEEVVIVGVGCLVLVLGAIGAAFYIGKGYNDPRIDSLEAQLKRVEAERDANIAEAEARAKEGAEAFAAGIDIAGAVAADDLERVRKHFPDAEDPSAQPDPYTDPAGGRGDV